MTSRRISYHIEFTFFMKRNIYNLLICCYTSNMDKSTSFHLYESVLEKDTIIVHYSVKLWFHLWLSRIRGCWSSAYWKYYFHILQGGGIIVVLILERSLADNGPHLRDTLSTEIHPHLMFITLQDSGKRGAFINSLIPIYFIFVHVVSRLMKYDLVLLFFEDGYFVALLCDSCFR